jgi:hypothetical protein
LVHSVDEHGDAGARHGTELGVGLLDNAGRAPRAIGEMGAQRVVRGRQQAERPDDVELDRLTG